LGRIINALIVQEGRTRLSTIETNLTKIMAVRSQRKQIENSGSDYDAKGSLVLPGLIDCHSHLFESGFQDLTLNLRSAKSISEVKERIVEYEKNPAVHHLHWLIGSGWDQDLFTEKRYPEKKDIDEVVPDKPAILSRICGHIAVLNSKALERMDFLRDYDDRFVPKSIDGSPKGIVKETALEECWKNIPQPAVEQLSEILRKAQDKAIKLGLVCIHCILSSGWRNELNAIKLLDHKGQLNLKLLLLIPIASLHEIESMSIAEKKRMFQGENFLVVGFKVFSDGSFGARTAALHSQYRDDSGNVGVLLCDFRKISQYALRAKKLKMILAVHAIGDRAVTEVAKGYREAGIKSSDGFRIEHCSLLDPAQITRLKGITLSIQPPFATSDYWINERLGNERKAYLWKTLSRVSKVIGGSDSPVEDMNPLKGICAATLNPNKSERLSFSAALELYSSNAASVSRFTREVGKISKGCDSNFMILDISDPRKICEANISQIFFKGQKLL
jgi:predicted amidohydrolase YtcJ